MKRFLKTLALLALLAQPSLAQQLLKVGQATTINIGPFIDDTDFKTLKTSLTVTSMTIKLIEQSDTFSSTVTSFSPTASGGSNDCQHVASGMYNCELTAAQIDTVGRLEVVATITSALPVFHRFEVIPATKYAETVTTGPASILDLLNYACSGATVDGSWGKLVCDNLNGRITDYSLVKNKTTIATLSTQTSFTLTAGSAENDAYNGWLILIQNTSTPERMAAGVVEDYTGSTKTVTLRTDPAVFTMAVGDNVYLVPDRSLKPTIDNRSIGVTATGGVTSNVTELSGSAVQSSNGYIKVSEGTGTGQLDLSNGRPGIDWNKVANPTTVVGLTNTTVKTATDAEVRLLDLQARVPTALVGGRMDSNVQAMATNVLTGNATDSTFVTKVQTGLVTAPKNTQYSNFSFRMFSTTGSPLTGLTVACQMSKDGAALATCTNAVTEVGGGVYKTNVAAGDLNVNNETYLIFSATGARPQDFKINVQR